MTGAARLVSLTDHEVVAEARAGNALAEGELVRRYEKPLMSLVVRLVKDPDTAADITQDTFLKAFAALGDYRAEGKFSTWIFSIGNHGAVDYLRRRKLNTVSIDRGSKSVKAKVMERANASDTSEVSLTTKSKARRRNKVDELRRAIRELRGDLRECFRLRHDEELSYASIARRLRLPVGTVKTYLNRARTKLRVALEEPRKGK